MGIIVLALVRQREPGADEFYIPTWVKVACGDARSRSGTYMGGWRIIRTLGHEVIQMDPAQGFAAQGAGAAVILSASHVGYPLSTTQVMSGAVIGSGATKRLSRCAGAWPGTSCWRGC